MKWHNKGEKYGIKDALLNKRKNRRPNKRKERHNMGEKYGIKGKKGYDIKKEKGQET